MCHESRYKSPCAFLRWYVRIFDGSDNPKEGWIPADILDVQRTDEADVMYSDNPEDAAYRRQ